MQFISIIWCAFVNNAWQNKSEIAQKKLAEPISMPRLVDRMRPPAHLRKQFQHTFYIAHYVSKRNSGRNTITET